MRGSVSKRTPANGAIPASRRRSCSAAACDGAITVTGASGSAGLAAAIVLRVEKTSGMALRGLRG
jgi:hypothetical protein